MSPYFFTFKKLKNRFPGINSARLCSQAGRFLAPIECLKILALESRKGYIGESPRCFAVVIY